jgi:hypothetical protein
VQGHELPAGEADVVIELERLPRLARLRQPLDVAGRVKGGHAHPVALDVVGVRVAALLVVGHHDVRPELPDQLDQRLGRGVDVLPGEAPDGQVGRVVGVVVFDPAGVDETQPGLPHAEDLAGALHLGPADLRQVGQDVRVVGELRVEHIAALAAGARDDEHLDALAHVTRHRGRALAGLVVRMCVHGHQAQLLTHHFSPKSLRRKPARREVR